jgi:hypothetical protein
LVQHAGIIEKALANQLFQQRVSKDGVLGAGLHGLGQCRTLGLGLAHELAPQPPALREGVEGYQNKQQNNGGEKVAWQKSSVHGQAAL